MRKQQRIQQPAGEAREENFSLIQLFSKQVGAIIGLFLLLLIVAFAFALISWNVKDPSFSFANGHEVTNKLGYLGAIYADLSMQFFGLGGAFLLIPPFCWAIFLLVQKLDFSLTRCFFYIPFFCCFFCFALCCYPLWPTNFLPQGAGGSVGFMLFSLWHYFIPYDAYWWRIILAFLSGLAGFFFLFMACGLVFAKAKVQKTEDPRFLKPLGFWEGWLGFFYHIRLLVRMSVLRFCYKTWQILKKACSFSSQKSSNQRKKVSHEKTLVGLAEQEFYNDIHVTEENSIEEDGEKIEHKILKNNPLILPLPHFEGKTSIQLPTLDFLSIPSKNERTKLSKRYLEENSQRLLHVLEDFGIHGKMLSMCVGPIVTLYEFEPAPGIKSSRIIGLSEDIARSLCAVSARVSIIAGRNAIGIELPNENRETVYLREILESSSFLESPFALTLALGKMINGEVVVADLAKMPHLLVAGTTGSGKSVAIHSMILSLLYRLGPDRCRFIMVDPKMLELSIYEGIPHLLTPVVTDPKKAVVALKWAVREMEDRYAKMSKIGVRNIEGFNQKVKEAHERGENLVRKLQTGFDADTGQPVYEIEMIESDILPYIVVIIDEMADLMLVAGKEIEALVQRLAQMARAAGIHVIMATQRPSVDVITGTIKANFPTRISFSVTSKIDSRTILGEQGAETLLGQGDMLFMSGGRRCQRVHGPFVFDHEVQNIVEHLKSQAAPEYLEDVFTDQDGIDETKKSSLAQSQDPYDQAVAVMMQDKRISTSYIQRRLSIGYNRAASIVERMEEEGLISAANHVGKREILIPLDDED